MKESAELNGIQNNIAMNVYSKKKLDFFEKILINKIEASEKELKILQNEMQKRDSNGTDDTYAKHVTIEDCTSAHQNVVIAQQIKSLSILIQSCRNAIFRIKNKTYGKCHETGELICEERLVLVPHTTLSMKGIEIREQKKKKRI